MSLDLIVDQANELYASLPGAGSSKEYPFVQINIKHLNLQDGTGENVLPNDMGSYKDNVQLNVDEHIQLKGFLIAGTLASYWPTDIYVTANAKLDLANVENNGTELYAALKIGHLDTTYSEEYLYGAAMPLELSYTNGTLSIRTDATTYLLQASGAADLSAYDMLLAGPIGNMIDGMLADEKLAAIKEAFDERYWATAPTTDEDGNDVAGKFNFNFQGLIVKNLDFSTVFNFVKGLFNKSETPAPEETTPGTTAAEEEPKAQIYNTIAYALTLFSGEKAGKVNLTSRDGLLGTVAKFAQLLAFGKLTTTEQQPAEDPEGEPTTVTTTYDWTKQGIIDWAVGTLDPLIKGFTGGMIGADAIFMFDGVRGADLTEVFDNAFEEHPDAIKAEFDFTNGFNWDITLGMHEDPEVAIKWTSRIGFGKAVPVQNIRDRLDQDIFDMTRTVEAAKAVSDAADKAYNDARATYQATFEYKDMSAKQKVLNDKRVSFCKDTDVAAIIKPLLSKGNSTMLYTGANGNAYVYWLNRYLVENGDKTAEEAMNAAYAEVEAYWADTNLYPEGKTPADLKTAFDQIYDLYKVKMGADAAAYATAYAKATATYLYKDQQSKLADKNYANAMYRYAQARLTAYTRYNTNNYDELKAGLEAATTADPAYTAARTPVDNAITKATTSVDDAYKKAVKDAEAKCEASVSGQSTNVYSYLPIEDYCKYYAANKIDSVTITNDVVQQKLTAVTSMIDQYKSYGVTLTEADVKAIAEEYSKAYDVTIDGSTPKAVKLSDSIKNSLNDYLKYYAGNQKDSGTITAAMVTAKLNALKALRTSNKLDTDLSDDNIAALAEKYAAAYDVTIDTTNKTVTGETNKLTYYTSAFENAYIWYEINFAEVTALLAQE